MNITRGRIQSAYKIAIYGVEGIGKSTLAAKFPDPVFIDTEDSTKTMDVARFDKPKSWTMLLEEVRYVIAHPECCKTLVIDTADWAEQLEIAELCAKKGWSGIEDGDFGKGYVYSAEEFGRLLNLLTEVTNKGVHVVVTAHAGFRKRELPEEMGPYDHWAMKTSKKIAPMIREWADTVLFLNYKILVVNMDGQGAQKGKNKAQGGKRVMYTTHTPFWDAKNRFGLPDELPLDYEPLRPFFEPAAPSIPPTQMSGTSDPPQPSKPAPEPPPAPTPQPDPPASTPQPDDPMKVPAKIDPLLKEYDVTEYEVREIIAARGQFPMGTTWKVMDECGFVDGWVLPFWDKIVQMIRDNPDRLPF